MPRSEAINPSGRLEKQYLIRDDSFLEICDPRLSELYHLWLTKCRDGQIPKRSDFDPGEMKSLLPFIFMVDRESESGDYRYRLLGTNEFNLRGYDATGLLVRDHCAAAVAQEALDNYDYVFNSKSILFDAAEANWDDNRRFSDQTLFLPTSSDGETVDIVIGIAVQMDI